MDLAGDPQDPDYHTEMKLHKKAFDYAHENNVNITIHAGEAEGPKSCEQVTGRPGQQSTGLNYF